MKGATLQRTKQEATSNRQQGTTSNSSQMSSKSCFEKHLIIRASKKCHLLDHG